MAQTRAIPAAMLLRVPTRQALRLRAFDYSSAGAYFVTVCTEKRRRTLGDVANDRVVLNAVGRIVQRQVLLLPERFDRVTIDAVVVMPNHVHILVELHERARQASPLRDVVGGFKSGSAREINLARGTPGAQVWQRGYYDRVIRDEHDLNRARKYIEENPIRWALDPENV